MQGGSENMKLKLIYAVSTLQILYTEHILIKGLFYNETPEKNENLYYTDSQVSTLHILYAELILIKDLFYTETQKK